MYLVCPSCDATYEISDRHFTEGMRQVRCDACGYQWLAGSDTADTISDLMGDKAEEAFAGLRGFLGSGKKDTPAKPVKSKNSAPLQVMKKNQDAARREAVLKMLGGDPDESPSSGAWLWATFVVLSVPIGIVALLVFGQTEIIKIYPEAAAIYEFVQTVGMVIYSTAEEVLRF